MSDLQNTGLMLMLAIVNKGKGEMVSSLFVEEGATFNLLSLARGTASKKMLAYFGLGETEKELLFGFVSQPLSRKMLEKLDKELALAQPGNGLAFCLPINGYSEALARKRCQGQTPVYGGTVMEQSYPCDLIIAVCNQGYVDDVMEAAKSAGATGGTTIHARGLGLKQTEKFFGITIQAEKDVLLIVTRKEHTRPIMDAISEQHGCRTDAHTIAFSLPVDGVVGMRALLEEASES